MNKKYLEDEKGKVIKKKDIDYSEAESILPKAKEIPMPLVKTPQNLRPIDNALKEFLESKDIKDFDKILEIYNTLNRTIIIEEIDEESGVIAENLIRFWNGYDNENNIPVEERQPIKIYIDSPGGYLSSMFTIIDSIRLSKTPVWTINIGCAYSGGFFIFISGHKRIAYPNSSFLYHEGSGTVSGDANKFQNHADFYKLQRKRMKDITLKYTKITNEQYDEHIKDDWCLFADEAIGLGIADEIANEFI